MNSAAQRVFDKLLPVQSPDLATFIGALGDVLFQEVDDYASDGPLDQQGWSVLLDLNRIPDKGLDWMAQFIGVHFAPGLTPVQKRLLIQSTDGWRRGTVAAMTGAITPYLQGTKTVIFKERDALVSPSSPAYGLTVVTKKNETAFFLKTASAPLTVSGNEITDAVRAANLALGTGASGNMCDGLLNDSSFGIRRAATNLFRRGQCDATTDWSQAGGGTTVMSLDATTPPPFSTQSIKLICNGGAGNFQGCIASSPAGLAAAAGQVGVGSMYFKGVAGLSYSARLRWTNTDTTTTFGTTFTFNATGAWQLVNAPSLVVGVGLTGDILRIEVLQATANRAETLWFAHAMLESGQPVVAPYVATSGGLFGAHSVARVQAPSNLVTTAQGWAAGRSRLGVPIPTPAFPNIWRGFFDWGGTDADSIQVYVSPGSSSISLRRVKTGGTGIAIAVKACPAKNSGDMISWAAAWTLTRLAISIDGSIFTAVIPDPSQIPALVASTFDISNRNVGQVLDADTKWFACGTGVLTDADAATLFALGDTAPDQNTLPLAAALSAVMPFDTSAYSDWGGPDPRILAALTAQKPAGILLAYSVLAGQDYQGLLDGNPLYSNIFANYATYGGVVNSMPGT